MPDALLRTEGLTKRFGGLVAVNRVDFTLERGVIASLIGPNGAGKTTFFNLVAGVLRPSAGRIWFQGQEIGGRAQHRYAGLGITRTFQNIRLFGNMTALDNVLAGMHPHLHASPLAALLRLPGMVREERAATQEARRLLELVGLGDEADAPALALPYGRQRRLELARALAGRPALLLLDEPVAGMNVAETHAMMDLVRRVRDQFDLTVLLIDHDMRLVMNISDRVTVFDHGERIAEGAPAVVQRDPAVIEAYLGPSDGEGEAQEVRHAAS